MLSPNRKSRLAIGVYESMGELCAPMAGLLSGGFAANQLGIICVDSLIAGARKPGTVEPAAWSQLQQFLSDTRPVAACGMPTILASPSIPGLESAATWLCSSTGWNRRLAPSSGRQSLEQLIRRGYPALTVAPSTNDEQRRCMGLLLGTSRFPVETHEFAFPEHGSPGRD